MPIYTCGKDCGHDAYKGCDDSQVTYEGKVLQTWENNGYDDSDFVAAVWSDEKQAVTTVTYGTTRAWTYHNNAVVDATDDVRDKARKFIADKAYERNVNHAERDHENPTVGKTVRSLTTRGKNKNAVGTVVARETNPYGTYYKNGYNRADAIYNQRVSVQIWGEFVNNEIVEFDTGDERMRIAWLAADKVEVIDNLEIDHDALRKNADGWANSESYMSYFHVSFFSY